MAETWQTNSESSWQGFITHARKLYDEHHWVTWSWRIGEDRSIDQNALFHVWCAEWIAYMLGKHYKTVEKNELASMKRTVKKMYLIANPDSKSWMIHEITDYTTGKKKKDYTSSKDWKMGEMYQVLTWMQLEAANQGLILESRGEFAKNQRKESA